MPPPLDDFKPTGTGEPPLARAEGLGALFGEGNAGVKHDAAMGGLVLVLPAVLRSA